MTEKKRVDLSLIIKKLEAHIENSRVLGYYGLMTAYETSLKMIKDFEASLRSKIRIPIDKSPEGFNATQKAYDRGYVDAIKEILGFSEPSEEGDE